MSALFLAVIAHFIQPTALKHTRQHDLDNWDKKLTITVRELMRLIFTRHI